MSTLPTASPASSRRDTILARIGALLAELYDERARENPPPPCRDMTAEDASIDGQLGPLARALYRERRLRDEQFGGDLAGEPGWDMLLDLFVLGGARQPIPVFAVNRRVGLQPMTARRWLDLLVAQRLIARSADPHKEVGEKVRLTTKGKQRIRAYLIETLALREHDAVATRPKTPMTRS